MPDDATPAQAAAAGRDLLPAAPPYAYKAFLSYSHAADSTMAARLQSGLEWFARPFYLGRAFRVFRDQTNLSANPGLWDEILKALEQSEYYLYLASPGAAQSPWVKDELDYWFGRRDPDKAFLVVSDGALAWDRDAGDFDWTRTDAMPATMKGRFRREPLWVDLTWARSVETFDDKDPRFQDALATLAAPLHGLSKDVIFGEHLRLRRRARRQRTGAIVLLALLSLVATAFGITSLILRDLAEQRAQVAFSGQLASTSDAERDHRLDRSMILGIEASDTAPTFEARGALFRALRARPGLSAFLEGPRSGIVGLAFSRDGAMLGASFPRVRHRDPSRVLFWDSARWRPLGAPLDVVRPDDSTSDISGTFDRAAFDTESRRLAFAVGSEIRLVGDGVPPGSGPTLQGPGEIKDLIIAPGGRSLAATYTAVVARKLHGVITDSRVAVWDLETGRRTDLTPFEGQNQVVASIAFAPDGRILAVAGRGGVALWDLDGRRRLGQILGIVSSEGQVVKLAFSPDGRTLAVVLRPLGNEGLLFLDVARGVRRAPPAEVTGVVCAGPVFTRDGSQAAVAHGPLMLSPGDTGYWTVAIWSIGATVAHAADLKVAEGKVRSLAFHPDGELLVAGYAMETDTGVAGGGVVLWGDSPRFGRRPARDGRLGLPLPVPEGGVWDVALHPDGRTLAAAFGDGFGPSGVAVWDLNALEGRDRDLAFFEPPVRVQVAPAQPPPGSATAGAPGVTIVAISRPPLRLARSVAFRPDSRAVAAGFAVGGFDPKAGGVVVWALPEGTRKELPIDLADGSIGPVAYHPNGKYLAAAYRRKGASGVLIWDTTDALLRDHPLQVPKAEVTGLAFRPDGNILAASYLAGASGGVALWDVPSWSPRKEPLRFLDENLLCVAFDPRGQYLAAAGGSPYRGGYLLLWDAARWEQRRQPVLVSSFPVLGLAFDPSGKMIATGTGTAGHGEVLLWEAATLRPIGLPLDVPEGDVTGVAFGGPGLLGAGFRTTLRSSAGAGDRVESGGLLLWDAATGRRLGPPVLLDGSPVAGVQFSPDGTTLAAGLGESPLLPLPGDRGGVLLLDVDPASWRRRAARIANRNLSWGEWQESVGPDRPYHATIKELPEGQGVAEARQARRRGR